MVWSPDGGAPTYRHISHQAAVHEAERLARKVPGRHFFVLQATDLRIASDMQRVVLVHPRGEIPF